ncbi:MAG: site-specific DNA-methyltransferase, partial [bacterium]|nr:site-specific DNA-methyltransferase [bacterium]
MPTINFKGKEVVRNYHFAVPYHELVPDEEKSLTKKVSLNDNLIIHGDNLIALKALLPTYAGRVKCIYIDPPYNTGNEKWVYNDNMNSPMMREWLGGVVDKDDLARHDKWLCMMMPRLKLLKELLCEDGVIFVSIDDNEVSALKQLMNEVFFEDNFIGQIVWRKRPNPPNDSKFIGRIHEYILGYRKTDAIQNFEKLERFDFSAYANPDDDPKGDWKTSPLVLTETQARPNLTYQIVSPSGKSFLHPHGWRIEKKLFDQLNANNEIYWGEKGDSFPMRKRYLSEDEGMLFNSIALSFGTTITARKEIKNIFNTL